MMCVYLMFYLVVVLASAHPTSIPAPLTISERAGLLWLWSSGALDPKGGGHVDPGISATVAELTFCTKNSLPLFLGLCIVHVKAV